MSDLDRELREAVKAGVERSLEGWTFTPAMRQAVLERIAAEEEPAATPDSSRRKSLKPAYWVAAAAAALILAVTLPKEGEHGHSGGAAPDAASIAGAELAPTPEPGASASGSARVMTGPRIGLEDTSGGEVVSPTAPQELDMITLTAAAAEPKMLRMRVEDVKRGMASAGAPGDDPGSAAGESAGDGAPGHGTGQGVAHATGHGTGGDPGEGAFITMMATPTMLDLHPVPGGQAAVLTATALQIVDEFGNVVAEEPLAQEPRALAAGPAGEVAVISDNAIARFTAGGQPVYVVHHVEAPALVAVSADRTAVVDADGVAVYAGEEPVLALGDMQAEAIALAEDGALALLTRTASAPRLHVYSADGTLMLDRAAEAGGPALTFLADGQQVAAGGEVYDRSGRLLWTLPFAAAEVAATGGGQVLAWNAQSAALLREATGEALWQAEAGDGVILQAAGSAGGELVAMVVAAAEGAAVWVVDSVGAERHAEWLAEAPVDVAIVGDHLHILTPGGLQVRSLSD